MKDALEKGYCTAPRCKLFLANGAGNQFVDPHGQDQRYCDTHWKELCDEIEEKPGEASIACGLMVGLGIVLLAIRAITGP